MNREQCEKIAWQCACETAVVTKEDVAMIYNRIMERAERLDKQAKVESNKTN